MLAAPPDLCALPDPALPLVPHHGISQLELDAVWHFSGGRFPRGVFHAEKLEAFDRGNEASSLLHYHVRFVCVCVCVSDLIPHSGLRNVQLAAAAATPNLQLVQV